MRWFNVEPPFPWVIVGGYVVLVGIILFALILGAFWWK
jgi:hypothetical protein